MTRALGVWFMIVCLLSCGGPEPALDSDSIGTTRTALCAGAPERHGQFVTLSGCRFEQQLRNIELYGDALEPQVLLDATGEPIAEVSHSCESWWLGTDLDGELVTLDSETGRVVSHGSLHSGFGASALPDRLPAPFTLR